VDRAVAPHHQATIDNVVRELAVHPDVEALLLTGSLAHGFAGDGSDVDVALVVGPEEYRRRSDDGALGYFSFDLATYPGGYVDGKYVDMDFLHRVAEAGSEPARFAFADARVLFSRIDGLDALLEQIVRYPLDGRDERVERFSAQMLAWQWYFGEGAARDDRYLMTLSTQKVVLFACRVVLARNELLYPYHKWLRTVTASAPDRPPGLLDDIEALLVEPDQARVDGICSSVFAHYGIDLDELYFRWSQHFLVDNELTWMTGHTPIDDL
jgi:predicted nucleotidyltransferase